MPSTACIIITKLFSIPFDLYNKHDFDDDHHPIIEGRWANKIEI